MERTVSRITYRPVSAQPVWKRIVEALLRADARYRARHAFRNLTPDLREDIGLPGHEPRQDGWNPPNAFWTKR